MARIGVGVGESGAIPTSHSLIGDYFTTQQRSAILAIFTSGATIGLTAGLTLGGYVAENYGWRWSFVVAAVVGLPVRPSRRRAGGEGGVGGEEERVVAAARGGEGG